MAPRLEFWFDFSCPFAYVASTQVEQLAQGQAPISTCGRCCSAGCSRPAARRRTWRRP
ncbi:hypothetical protein OV079_46935 [Nannocystis pusilla]|uniref:DSBA-like thioredoxin domain-containing protein n=1 Tax=Nannocystis pusilla TaxID=889268 RepID=A0A9X3EZ60_9BACT|nr:hypothetical protein [Nannocystis pusilla]MCY1012952.1 hypothetical protein [Nannocystis pusilla]